MQFLSDRDPSPWAAVVGFIPDEVTREAREVNHADLLLTSGARTAVIEVKLGHLMSAEQQDRYEALGPQITLHLTALASDQVRLVSDSERWTFHNLADLIGRWQSVADEPARLIARETAAVLRSWDETIAGVFRDPGSRGSMPLSALDQKFLARVVARRLRQDLRDRGRLAFAGVASGGGLPIIQGWTPIRDEQADRTFIAEIRWRESTMEGEFRFGVDFSPRPDQGEDEEVRRAAYGLALSMTTVIDYSSLRDHLADHHPRLEELLRRERRSRPRAKGDWERVMAHGFTGAPLADGRKNNRRRTSPDFYGDGALRFQAVADVDLERATASDLTDLIDVTLTYLSSRQP